MSSEKLFKYYEAVKLTVVDIIFSKIFIFTWKLKFYHWQQVLSTIFLDVTAHLIPFWENICKTPTWITSLSVSHSFKYKGHFMGKAGSSVCLWNKCSSFSRQTSASILKRSLTCTSHSAHRILKRCVLTMEV